MKNTEQADYHSPWELEVSIILALAAEENILPQGQILF